MLLASLSDVTRPKVARLRTERQAAEFIRRLVTN